MIHSDLLVVGAGIMGLAHAYHAARAGMSVTVLDRSDQAKGASVRNFGMLAVLAQSPGQQRDDALRSLNSWRKIGAEAGLDITQSGCLILAKHTEELNLLLEFTNNEEASSGSKLLRPSRLSQYAQGLCSDKLLGALWSEEAWKVDQRLAMRKITSWLQRSHNVNFHFSCNVHDISMPLVQTSSETFSSAAVIICAGNEFTTLFPDSFKCTGVSTCKLQMLRTQPQPTNWQLKPFILGGLSLSRYAAFTDCLSLNDLKAMQQHQYRRHLEYGIHVVACQEADGSITIGDSHAYADETCSERSTEIDKLILDELRTMITLPHSQIVQRWHGRYAHLPNTDVLKLFPTDNVIAVTATHGQGMTHGFAIAEDVINSIAN